MKWSKKKRLFLLGFTIAALSCLFLNQHQGKPMKLIHNKTGFVVVEFSGNKAVFKDRFLEKEMKLRGIRIPPAMREKFEGKSVVLLEDKDFLRAFKEVYCKYTLDETTYHWEDKA